MFSSVRGSVEWFNEIKKKKIILIGYRGDWCPFCKDFLTNWNELHGQLSEMGYEIYGICSQNDSIVQFTQKNWNLSFPLVSVEDNALPRYLKESGIIKDLFISKHKGYPYDMVQPFVYISIPQSNTPIYVWAQEPTASNFGGAKDRPIPSEIFEVLKNTEIISDCAEKTSLFKKAKFRTRGMFNVLCIIS